MNYNFQSRGPDEPGDTVVNIENDSEGPYMQDFFGDVSTIYICACVRDKYRLIGKKGFADGLVGPVFFGFHY